MFNYIYKYIKSNWILILILGVGLFFRTYKFKDLFLYGHDQDLLGWFIRDVVENKHVRLIGQETSTQGVFIGPLFYYLMIPFYLIGNMDPIYTTFAVSLIGIFAIWSSYFVIKEISNKVAGLIAAFVYSFSFYTIFTDREVVPTMPLMLWSIWFLYVLYLLYKKDQKNGFLLAGVLIGLIWHINVSLVIVIPLLLISFIKSKAKLNLSSLSVGLVTIFILVLPLITFEIRHGFLQTKAVITSFTSDQHDIVEGTDKFKRVIHLVSKNISGLFVGSLDGIKYEHLLFILLGLYLYLVYKKEIKNPFNVLIGVWIIVFISFFSLYSKIVSEYYLNGLTIVWIYIFSVSVSILWKSKDTKIFSIIILILFALFNSDKYFHISINKSGYIERKELVQEIKDDSRERGYPCVSISYITKPGYNLGYRYFFYLMDLKMKKVSEHIPVYTIVYPLDDKLFPTNNTFGAIGLIYPDYKKYDKELVKSGCEGDNINMVEPMYGLTY